MNAQQTERNAEKIFFRKLMMICQMDRRIVEPPPFSVVGSVPEVGSSEEGSSEEGSSEEEVKPLLI